MHPDVIHEVVIMFRRADLESSRHVGLEKRVSIFLYIAGQVVSNRAALERFQRSGKCTAESSKGSQVHHFKRFIRQPDQENHSAKNKQHILFKSI